MMASLKKAVKIVLEKCLALKQDESCLILTDNTGDKQSSMSCADLREADRSL